MAPLRALLLAAALAAAAVAPATALSWPLCEDGGQVWVTEAPRTEPGFIGANLWFFCEGKLNILGMSVHNCVDNGTLCSDAVPNAMCEALGFDRAVMEDVEVVEARPDEPVRALTGEYCLRAGNYSERLPPTEELAALPGQPCTKMDKLTCIRTRETIITSLDQARLEAFQPAPPASEPAVPAGTMVTPAEIKQVTEASGAAPAEGATGGGRRLLRI